MPVKHSGHFPDTLLSKILTVGTANILSIQAQATTVFMVHFVETFSLQHFGYFNGIGMFSVIVQIYG